MDRPGSGFRRLIGLLLVLNLGTLAAGWAGSHWLAQRSPLVAYNAEKIRLLDEARPERPGEPARAAAPEAVTADTAPTAPAAEAPACLGWATLDADGLARVEAHLREAGVVAADYDLLLDKRLGWWVYLPPFENAGALKVVMEDARAKGIKDMAPVRSGPMRNALALGAFPSHAAARAHAEAMDRKGLRGVRYGPRPGSGFARLAVLRESPHMRQALAASWPAGLAPAACPEVSTEAAPRP